jgi:hypothetical protein
MMLDYDGVAADDADFHRLKNMMRELIDNEHAMGERSLFLQSWLALVEATQKAMQ